MPWPNPDALGFPADTETRQFHMVSRDGEEHIVVWEPEGQEWSCFIGRLSPRAAASCSEYLGPAQVRLTPENDDGPASDAPEGEGETQG